MFRRSFAQAGGLRIHYRTAGSGPPVVMLHPSPLSSTAVLPVARAIASTHQVFALDTPGYGLSQPLPSRPRSLDEYLPPLAAVLDALGIDRCCLYGAATGAQIALEFAASHPERIALLVMDTAGHIPPEQCQRLVEGYFPDVTPRSDGSHLPTLWSLVRDLGVFFPWNDARPEARIARDLPSADQMQAFLLDYLRAGTGYDWAYRPAFFNERAERVHRCKVPALLTRWPSSIALSITDALIAEGLPGNFAVVDLGPSLADRADGIATAIAERWLGAPARGPSTPVQPAGFAGLMLDAGELQLHARVADPGCGRPLVVLHRAGAAASRVEPVLGALSRSRPLLAIDLPGHGESDAAYDDDDAPVEALMCALQGLGLDQADLFGDGLGAIMATRLAQSMPGRFRRLALVSRWQGSSVKAPWPALVPRLDGAHLLEGWFMLRDRRLWQPWHERSATHICHPTRQELEAASIHADLVELCKCGPRFPAAARREADFDPAGMPPGWHTGMLVFQERAAGPGTPAGEALPRHQEELVARLSRWLDA